MKKLLLLLLGVVMTLPTFARDFTYEYAGQTLYYTVYDENEKTAITTPGIVYENGHVTQGNPYAGGDVSIPAKVNDGVNDYEVVGIGDLSFLMSSGITAIEFPGTLKFIGQDAFYGCYGITSLNLPNSLTEIGARAFYDCYAVTSLTLPNSVKSVGERAFFRCYGLTSLKLSDSLTELGQFAFGFCHGLTSVTLPASVTTLGFAPFIGCNSLNEINVEQANKNFTSIDGVLFDKNVTKLLNAPGAISGDYRCPTTVTSVEDDAFYGCTNLKSATFPESFAYVGNDAFWGCTGLTSVSLPNTVSEIGNYAFHNCNALKSINIPTSLSIIGNCAFYNCSSLTSVTFTGALSKIGHYAFWGCNGLSSVTIPASVSELGNGPFANCANLKNITVEKGNQNYTSDNGVLFNKELSVLIDVSGAFEGKYEIPETVKKIGIDAFAGCKGIVSVSIPNSVNEIGAEAFYNCTGLSSIVIPGSVTKFGTIVFKACSGLTSVYYNADEPVEGSADMFDEAQYENATLFVPEAAVGKCATVNPWMNFKNIQAHDFSGIEAVETDSNAPCEVFGLNGVCVGTSLDGLAPGIYIIRQGGSVKKIAVK